MGLYDEELGINNSGGTATIEHTGGLFDEEINQLNNKTTTTNTTNPNITQQQKPVDITKQVINPLSKNEINKDGSLNIPTTSPSGRMYADNGLLNGAISLTDNRRYNDRFADQDRYSSLSNYNAKHALDGTNKGLKFRLGQVGHGLYDAIVNTPTNFVKDPIEDLRGFGELASMVASGIKSGASKGWNAITHPKQTIGNIKNAIKDGNDRLNSIDGQINQMSRSNPIANIVGLPSELLRSANDVRRTELGHGLQEGIKEQYGQGGMDMIRIGQDGKQTHINVDVPGFLQAVHAHPFNTLLDFGSFGAVPLIKHLSRVNKTKKYMKAADNIGAVGKIKNATVDALDKATTANPNIADKVAKAAESFGYDASKLNDTTAKMQEFNKMVTDGKTPKYSELQEKAIEHSKLANEEQSSKLIDELTHGVENAKPNETMEEFSQRRFGKSADDLSPDEWNKLMDEYEPPKETKTIPEPSEKPLSHVEEDLGKNVPEEPKTPQNEPANDVNKNIESEYKTNVVSNDRPQRTKEWTEEQSHANWTNFLGVKRFKQAVKDADGNYIWIEHNGQKFPKREFEPFSEEKTMQHLKGGFNGHAKDPQKFYDKMIDRINEVTKDEPELRQRMIEQLNAAADRFENTKMADGKKITRFSDDGFTNIKTNWDKRKIKLENEKDYTNEFVEKNFNLNDKDTSSKINEFLQKGGLDNTYTGLTTTMKHLIENDVNNIIHPTIKQSSKYLPSIENIDVLLRDMDSIEDAFITNKYNQGTYTLGLNTSRSVTPFHINHELGHVLLFEMRDNPIINKIGETCRSATKEYTDFMKSIGCKNGLDVLNKYGDKSEEAITSLRKFIKYDLSTEEMYVDAFARTNKYVDIDKFEKWYNNIKPNFDEIDDYETLLRESFSQKGELSNKIDKYFIDNAKEIDSGIFTNKRTSVDTDWGKGKLHGWTTTSRNGKIDVKARFDGTRENLSSGIKEKVSKQRTDELEKSYIDNGIPEQPKSVTDSKPVEHTTVSKNDLKDVDFGDTYNGSKARKYVAETSKDTENTLIELGLLDKEQAANRLKQQSSKSGEDKAYFKGKRNAKDGINLDKDYNAATNSKEGLFGKKTKDGINEIGTAEDITRQEINRNTHAHYTKNTTDYVANNFALPIENGKIKDGYIGVNRTLLNHMVHGRYSSEWYKTMASGEDAIRKAFKDKGVADAWVDVANKNSKNDFQIPKAVFDTLADGSAENAAVYWDRYARFDNPRGLAKGMGKFAGATTDALLNGFKRRVLASGSFVLNNRLGNQIMIYNTSKNPIEYLKSFYGASKLKDTDVPIELLQSNIAEAAKDSLTRKTYTGYNALDNAINLFNGQLIDTKNLKGMKKGLAKGANIIVGYPNKWFNKLSETIMNFNDRFERFERKQKFAQAMDKQRLELIKKTGQLIVKDTEVLKHINGNSEIAEAVIREVEDALGNYRAFNKFEKNVMKRIIPFYSWYRTITRHTLKLATTHPEKIARVRLELMAIGIDQRGDYSKKEYQKHSVNTGEKDTRSGKELVVNKEHANPYNTFREDIGYNPYITTLNEMRNGKKNFLNQEITNDRYVRQTSYDGGDKKTGYYDLKENDWVRDNKGKIKYDEDYDKGLIKGALPKSTRLGYGLKTLAKNTVAPYIDNPIINVEQLGGALDNKLTNNKNKKEKGNLIPYDKSYDASIGGYNNGDIVGSRVSGKRKNVKKITRFASNDLSPKNKTLNMLGLGIQNRADLNKAEREEYKEKSKRIRQRMKNSK